MKKIFLLLLLNTLLLNVVSAQDPLTNRTQTSGIRQQTGPPDVYLDCRRCDFDFIRTEIDFVNYVRDPEMADIHVFVTDERTAGDGREFQFTFIGLKVFAGIEYMMKHHVAPNTTIAEQREAINRFLTMGFASFMLQTPLGCNFTIIYADSTMASGNSENEDPWNQWIFQSYVGGINLELESNQRTFNSRWGIFADKVTEEWKFRLRPYFNYNTVFIQPSETADPVNSQQHRHGFDSYAIKSLTDHWSAGLFGTYFTASSRNIRHEFLLQPGIEYSLFPYREATRRAITLTYLIGYGYYDYYDETIFSKTEESLLNHQLKGMVNVQQPWEPLRPE